MEDTNKIICPYCETEINEGDTVTVCPKCSKTHHKKCWDEHNGCSVCDYRYEPYSEQQTEENIDDGQIAVDNNVSMTKICTGCGTVYQIDQNFCPNCGKGFNISTPNSPPKKRILIPIIIAAFAAVVLLITGITFIPKITVSVDKLCEQGEYEKAYKKAKGQQKTEVLAENAAAVQSFFASENLKNPSSFELREAYYYETTNSDDEGVRYLVLYIGGSNSYGGIIGNYWLFTRNDTDDEWNYFDSVSDLEKEDYKSYDDADDILDKYVDNLCIDRIKDAITNGIKLSKDSVKRINNMFESDTLEFVTILDSSYYAPIQKTLSEDI